VIAEGYEWHARDLATAADQIAKEAGLSVELIPPAGSPEERLMVPLFRTIYAGAVRDVLRWLAGDMPAPTPWLREINQRYSDNIDPYE
jgi:hypothetical protein